MNPLAKLYDVFVKVPSVAGFHLATVVENASTALAVMTAARLDRPDIIVRILSRPRPAGEVGLCGT